MNCVITMLLTATTLSSGAALAQDNASAPASADEQSDQDRGSSSDIIVTAQKRSERLLDVPVAITAVSGSQLAAQGVNGPADLERVAPGFTFRPSSYGQPIFQIRGIGFFEESFGLPPTVSVYVDQVALPFAAMTEGAALDIERVEVLKGPQGTLFGQNSTGGAVNYIAAKPTDTLNLGVDAIYGRFGQADIGGFISGPITSTLRARVSAKVERRGDWQKSYTRLDSAGNAVLDTSSPRTLGQRNFMTGRILLDWDASDSIKFELNLNGWRNRSDTQALQYIGYSPINSLPGRDTRLEDNSNIESYPQPPRNARYADWDPDRGYRRNDKFYQASLRGDAELTDDITLTSITAYSKLNAFRPVDNDGTQFLNLTVENAGDVSSFSQELRLAGSAIDRRLRWMIGANYQSDQTRENQRIFFSGTNTVFRFDRDYFFNNNEQRVDKNDAKTKSVFASLDFKPIEAITFYASARYTDIKRDYRGCSLDPDTGDMAAAFSALSNALTGGTNPNIIPAGGCFTLVSAETAAATGRVFGSPAGPVSSSLDEDNLSWRAGLDFKPSENILLYANVTKGYKSGSYANITLVFDNQAVPVTQESIISYEAGFKATLLDRRVQLAGAIYHLDYRDKQLGGFVATPPFGNLPTLIQIPKSRVNGAELEATIRPTTGLTLRGGVSYVDSKVLSDFATVDFDGDTFLNRKGDPFPGTPKWQLTSDVDYQFPIMADWAGFVGGGVTYRTKTRSYFGDTPIGVVDGYALVDLRLGIKTDDDRYRVQFFGRNVFNKFYTQTVSNIQDTVTRAVGMPATYGITLSARY